MLVLLGPDTHVQTLFLARKPTTNFLVTIRLSVKPLKKEAVQELDYDFYSKRVGEIFRFSRRRI
jgi:hypothetical protein